MTSVDVLYGISEAGVSRVLVCCLQTLPDKCLSIRPNLETLREIRVKDEDMLTSLTTAF